MLDLSKFNQLVRPEDESRPAQLLEIPIMPTRKITTALEFKQSDTLSLAISVASSKRELKEQLQRSK